MEFAGTLYQRNVLQTKVVQRLFPFLLTVSVSFCSDCEGHSLNNLTLSSNY